MVMLIVFNFDCKFTMKFLILQQVDALKFKFSPVYYSFFRTYNFVGVAYGDGGQGECLPWVPSASVA